MHDDNARILRLPRVVELRLFSFICNGSGILRINTCQHLHQCGLSGSVLPHQRVYLTTLYLKIYMVKRMHTRERLVNIFHR